MKIKEYTLKEIKEILDKAEDSAGLKEWYYPEVIAKLLFNQELRKQMRKKK